MLEKNVKTAKLLLQNFASGYAELSNDINVVARFPSFAKEERFIFFEYNN